MTSTKKTFALCLAATGALGLGSSWASAQGSNAAAPPAGDAPLKPATLGLAVYPGSGQDATKQAKDEGECYTWAKQQTGLDPTAPVAAPAPTEKPRGGGARGAARGAAKGAAVGAVVDNNRVVDEGNLDAGEGAAAGAAVGAAKGRRAQKKAAKQAEAQAQQTAKTQNDAAKQTFAKSWGVCLEGRGYNVK